MKNQILKTTLLLSLVAAPLFIGASAHAQKSGECKTGPALIPLLGLGEKDRVTCLDSFQADGSITALFLTSGYKGSTKEGLLYINATQSKDTQAVYINVKFQFEDSELLSQGCGQYLMGGRVLPSTTKVALLFAGNRVEFVDFRGAVSGSAEKPIITMGHDERIPGMAYTCQGYFANWDVTHKDDSFKLDPQTKTIVIKTIAREAVEQPQLLTLKAEERAYYSYAYEEECTGKNSDRNSTACQDFKQARDEGTFRIRKMVRPERKITVQY